MGVKRARNVIGADKISAGDAAWMLTSARCSRACSPARKSEISGASGSLLIQLLGVATTVVYGLVVSFAILKIIDLSIGLRVTEEQEREGLDILLHGESIE